jgi:hypothetical protein
MELEVMQATKECSIYDTQTCIQQLATSSLVLEGTPELQNI